MSADPAATPSHYYRHHVFVCTNERADSHPRGCCRAKGAEPLRNYMKARVKELGLPATRINMAGCLDRCELGPVLVVYPDAIWYRYTDQQDIDRIIEEHLIGGKPVAELMLADDQPNP